MTYQNFSLSPWNIQEVIPNILKQLLCPISHKIVNLYSCKQSCKENKLTPMCFLLNSRSHTVSHFSYAPPFQGPHFLTKCWNQTFYMIIYLLTFYLFDKIEKKSLLRIILQRQGNFGKNLVQPVRIYFLFAFCARNYPW